MGLWVPKKPVEAKKFQERYSSMTKAPPNVIEAIRKIDPKLDLKVYLPTGQWHMVRYPQGRGDGKEFVRCFTLTNDEELGKQSHPGMWLVDYLHKCDTQKRDLLKETERNEAEWYRNKDAQIRDLAQNMAEEMRKPLQSDMEGTVVTKTLWQGADLGDK